MDTGNRLGSCDNIEAREGAYLLSAYYKLGTNKVYNGGIDSRAEPQTYPRSNFSGVWKPKHLCF